MSISSDDNDHDVELGDTGTNDNEGLDVFRSFDKKRRANASFVGYKEVDVKGEELNVAETEELATREQARLTSHKTKIRLATMKVRVLTSYFDFHSKFDVKLAKEKRNAGLNRALSTTDAW